ncbi:hypothetical protein PFISCL1PPCAC_16198, partial [Pristionchus fissidentatus]
MSFILKLFLRMIDTIKQRTSSNTITSQPHNTLIYALVLETILPLTAFTLPTIGLTLGLALSNSDPTFNVLSFLFHSSHALFISIATVLFYLRYHQTPNQYISTKV